MPLPTLEEMTAWTAEDIEAAIRQTLPQGTAFECGFDRQAGQWFVRVLRLVDGATQVAFEDSGIDRRITYFNAYGWIWARQQPKPSPNSPWVRRREVTRDSVQQTVAKRTRVPDPADVDPEEIAAVYAAWRGHQKR